MPLLRQQPRPFAVALLALCSLVMAGAATARDCSATSKPQLLSAQFTSAVRSQQPQDRLLFLPTTMRVVFIHATTRDAGKITYRWFRDGKRVIDVSVKVGAGKWGTWSRLRVKPPSPQDLRVQILGTDGCVLGDMTLASSAYVEDPRISRAAQQLAANDATGAKLTLKVLLEESGLRPDLRRAAKRMLDVDVPIAQAAERAVGDELFLVEPMLRDVEKRLGDNAIDRGARTRIRYVRSDAAQRRKELGHEDAMTALATRSLLATVKLFSGDFPLLKEDAERVVNPALVHAGDEYAMVAWTPTLRGYRLVLQDKRSGDAFDVTPD